ncbi:hypothetical protein [uncultured Fibrella sp.]|uniref:hypothetical protein n=1 Tax=uncultured Fibrella sp. TaxID=1284596 RepID=UPI0035CC01AA
MTVVTVAIHNEKAMQLLRDLADLNLIELLPSPSTVSTESVKKKLSSFIGQLNTGQTLDQLDEQLGTLRNEWERPI